MKQHATMLIKAKIVGGYGLRLWFASKIIEFGCWVGSVKVTLTLEEK